MIKKLKAIILARGGSKGVRGKNIKKINGIPLLAYPIIAARNCKYISQIYVSTDNLLIKKVGLEYGAKIIDRPDFLAKDDSTDLDSLIHAIKELNCFDDIVQLRATTPMIESQVLDQAIEYFHENEDCSSLRSAHESPETAYKSFKKNGIFWNGLFDSELTGEYYNWPRQKLPKTYHPNGYIDIVRPIEFMENNSLHGNKMLSFITAYAQEVDTINDFKILEALYDKN
mgnify:CR=1 FL=1